MLACQTGLVNRFLQAHGGGYGKFIKVSDHAGGTKHLECRVYLSAFNHADTETILKAVDQAPWRDKEMVQVFVKEQEEELFRVFGTAAARKLNDEKYLFLQT